MTLAMADTLLRLCATSDVEEDEPFRVEVDGFAYAVARNGDEYFVTADLCSHGPGSLSDGVVDGYEVECPFHGGRFDMRTGEATAAPCWEPILVWTAVVEDGAVFIDPTTPKAAPACSAR